MHSRIRGGKGPRPTLETVFGALVTGAEGLSGSDVHSLKLLVRYRLSLLSRLLTLPSVARWSGYSVVIVSGERFPRARLDDCLFADLCLTRS